MNVKKHLEGGSLRRVMVEEIKRCFNKYQNDSQPIERAALELGITPRTLRVWKGPEEKGGWKELQGNGGMELLNKALPKGKFIKRTRKKLTVTSRA